MTNAIEYAKKQGIEEGLEKGMEKGIEKGMEKGMEKAMTKVVINALKRGLGIDEIVALTGLTPAKIKKIKDSRRLD